MAVFAFFAVASLMHVVQFVAGVAGFAQLFLVDVFALMALAAADVFMLESQLELGLAIMIESLVEPTLGCVAFFTLGAELAFVFIVQLMAADAVFGNMQVLFTGVAILALYALMLAFKWKLGFIMIKGEVPPLTFAVAHLAEFTQAALVRFVLFVAFNTATFGIAVFEHLLFVGGFFMTVFTFGFFMAVAKRKIGIGMVKCFLVQEHDFCRASFVFGVADTAVFPFYFRRDAVITLLFDQVNVNFFVTFSAESFLAFFVERFMAVATFLFIFGVGG